MVASFVFVTTPGLLTLLTCHRFMVSRRRRLILLPFLLICCCGIVGMDLCHLLGLHLTLQQLTLWWFCLLAVPRSINGSAQNRWLHPVYQELGLVISVLLPVAILNRTVIQHVLCHRLIEAPPADLVRPVPYYLQVPQRWQIHRLVLLVNCWYIHYFDWLIFNI